MLASEFQADRLIQDKKGRTVVMVAALGGHSKIVESLLADYPYNDFPSYCDRVLFYACAGGNISLVWTLVLD